MFKKATITKLIGTSAFIFATLGMTSAQAAYRHHHQRTTPVTDNAGFYVGAGAGYGKVNEKIQNAVTRNTGFIYNVNGGYQFDKYIALEGGYTQFPDVKVYGYRFIEDNNLIDIAAKGIIPITDSFNLFAKLGAARVYSKTLKGLVDPSTGKDLSGTHTKILPYLGAGASYALTQQVSLDIQVAGTPKSGLVPAMYGTTAGLTYHF